MSQVVQGDCLEVMRTLPDNSVDCLITDPPAGIAFMGKAWDGDRSGMIHWVNWLSEILSEALRVMKPGACGAVWSIPRTCGWTQLAIELAGFRVWDSVAIMQGQGFPKAQQLPNGWKTPALKPSHENWFLIQKPCEDSIARNVLKWGTGGVNVKAVRIGAAESLIRSAIVRNDNNVYSKGLGAGAQLEPSGRYPANTILICAPECEGDDHAEHCPVSILGVQSGERKSGGGNGHRTGKGVSWNENTCGLRQARSTTDGIESSTGTAARYFQQIPHDSDTFHYFPKTSKSDRTCNGAVDNVHPTVKSTALMEYFCKLLCPPDGIVLDPFGGSGSTALGAIAAGVNYLLIEQEAEYVAIAQERINARIAKPEQLSFVEAS